MDLKPVGLQERTNDVVEHMSAKTNPPHSGTFKINNNNAVEITASKYNGCLMILLRHISPKRLYRGECKSKTAVKIETHVA